MIPREIVSHDEWIEARIELLKREKEFTRMRDELAATRRKLPWEKVEKEYVFWGPDGKLTLSELFDGKSQLIVYHFMFGPDWTEGCVSCSMIADHYAPSIVHLEQRDVAMATVSHAPFEKLEEFRKRMAWNIKWLSSFGSDFNRDYQVSFSDDELQFRKAYYNYKKGTLPSTEGPGISVFLKADDGAVYHTYSAYERGLDMFLGVYHLLDTTPKGRDEAELAFPMAWVRHHDRYVDCENTLEGSG